MGTKTKKAPAAQPAGFLDKAGHQPSAEITNQKELDAARLRKDRLKKQHRLLIAEQLTTDVPVDLATGGPTAHAVVAFCIMEKLTGRATGKLAYMKQYWGWEPTAEESETGWDKRDAQGRTPWQRYILGQLAGLSLADKQHLYFVLKVRHRMDHEYEDLQFSIAHLVGEAYAGIEAQAEQAVQLHYYTPEAKKPA